MQPLRHKLKRLLMCILYIKDRKMAMRIVKNKQIFNGNFIKCEEYIQELNCLDDGAEQIHFFFNFLKKFFCLF